MPDSNINKSKSTKLKLIFNLSILIVGTIILGVLLIMLIENQRKSEKDENLENYIINEEFIILEIPIIEYLNNDQLTEPKIVEYQQKIIHKNDEFIIDPSTLGSKLENSVGSIKLQLIDILSESIVIDVLADVRHDGDFYPRTEIERLIINTNSCISAYPLVMDVFYQYCFELFRRDEHIVLRYHIEEETTFPMP